MSTRLDDDMVAKAIGPLDKAIGPLDNALDPLDETANLPAATVAALRLADVLTSEKPVVEPEFYAELREYFTDGQILELGSALAVASGWQTFIEAFGIRPDGPWLDGVR